MKTMIFSDKFDMESVGDFIMKVEDVIGKNPMEKISIYFQSGGGETKAGMVLLDYLNVHKDKIIMIGNYSLESCAFDVFVRCRNEKRILENTTGMIHSINTTYDTIEIRDRENPRHLYLELDELINGRCMDFYRELGATEDEIEMMEKGKEVVITYERFLRILKIQKEGGESNP